MTGNLQKLLDKLPTSKGVVVVLSGGMDSAIALRLAVQKYGPANVAAITFDYGQRQSAELEMADRCGAALEIRHHVRFSLLDLGCLAQGFSANVTAEMKMPTIKEVLGDARPKTYVPNRNMIMLSIAAAYAEVQGLEHIICGLQVHDAYGYHDTTQAFVNDINTVLAHNRIQQIKIIAPFSDLSKTDELRALIELEGGVRYLKNTLTCYNPTAGVSCGKCPSCAERIQAFKNLGLVDPVPYSIEINW